MAQNNSSQVSITAVENLESTANSTTKISDSENDYAISTCELDNSTAEQTTPIEQTKQLRPPIIFYDEHWEPEFERVDESVTDWGSADEWDVYVCGRVFDSTDSLQKFQKTYLERLQSAHDELSKYSATSKEIGEKRSFGNLIGDEISTSDKLLTCLGEMVEMVEGYRDMLKDTKKKLRVTGTTQVVE
ncbi:hypothetical protein ACLOAV_004519 [Pseudogymnoascus australis]